jgi:hypothetical protein
LKTAIRDLDIARAAAAALGIPVLEGVTDVASYYAKAGKHSHPAALVFGEANQYEKYRMGLQAQDDGTYAMIGDAYMVSDKDLLRQLGPDMHQWEYRDGGHVCTGRPTSFLQEYALQAGIQVANTYAMHWTRLPADPEADDAPAGGEKLVLTGGYLPPHLSMTLIALPDGTSRVRFDGTTGNPIDCYEFTRDLEAAIGVLALDTPHALSGLDTVHTQAREHVAR